MDTLWLMPALACYALSAALVVFGRSSGRTRATGYAVAVLRHCGGSECLDCAGGGRESRLSGVRVVAEIQGRGGTRQRRRAESRKTRPNQLSPVGMGLRDAEPRDREQRDLGRRDVGTFLVVGAQGILVAGDLDPLCGPARIAPHRRMARATRRDAHDRPCERVGWFVRRR